jgi:alkaline phosphatase
MRISKLKGLPALVSKSFAILWLGVGAGCTRIHAAAPATAPPVDNIILMVADGAGIAYWSAAKLRAAELAVQSMPVVGLVDTRSASSRPTDSAAGATAYSTGQRVFNRSLSVRCESQEQRDAAQRAADPNACTPLETVFEAARKRGMATGLVTTTSVIDATPAAFVAHVPDRYMRSAIAEQFTGAGLDVLIGAGRGRFVGVAGADGRDLWEQLCARATCASDAREFAAYRPEQGPLVAVFPGDILPAAAERSPSLEQLTRTALERLSRNPRGFVAVVETEHTDEFGHNHHSADDIAAEVIAFDRAIAAALEFARAHPRTLVLVTADHETGGMALDFSGDTLRAAYTTAHHTAEMVPLFAAGAGAERFGGMRENYEIGRILMGIVRSHR